MIYPNHDDREPAPTPSEQERLAKLRALGREMRTWHRFDKRFEAFRSEAAEREQRHLVEEQRYRAEEQRYLRELENAKSREEALAADLSDTRRIAADRERELQAYLENYRLQLQQVVSSRSWKITQPLRDITKWVGKAEDNSAAVPAQPGPPSVEASAAVQNPPPTQPQQEAEPAQDAIETPVSEPGSEPAAAALAISDQAAVEPSVAEDPQPAADDFVTAGKTAWDETGSSRLRDFLARDGRLTFPAPAQPAISIIIALFNKAHLDYLCFESLLQHAGENYELILVDNGSSDDTARLLERIDGAKIIRNRENKGFGSACMQGVERAAGEYLCFLNNDVVLCPGTLEAAVANFHADTAVGAVGGKLLLSDGRLQEAGSIVWRDATAWGYGREDKASSLKYSFRRPVDYCSGALLFTPRHLFVELGGFDARFLPAYYEDTDYCFKVWEAGRKVIYEPRAVVHHYESASLQNSEAAQQLIADHRASFAEKWERRLQRQLPLAGSSIPYARIAAQAGGARIVYMCPRIPHRDLGAEADASNEFIARLASEGHHVTCVSIAAPLQAEEYPDIPREIELADGKSDAHYIFRQLLSQYDAVWIAGATSMREFLEHMWDMAERVPPIFYEVDEISPEGDDAPKSSLDEELTLCCGADVVLVKSEDERQTLQPNFAGRIEIRSQQIVRQLLAEIVPPSNPLP